MGLFGDRNRKPGLLGLRSRVTRRIFKQVALIGGAVAILVATAQAFWAYENALASTKRHIETIGLLVAPPLTENLWKFDTAQIVVQLDGLMSSTEVAAVRLEQVNEPDIYRERTPISGNDYQVVFPLRYTEDGKTHALGKLTIIPDLATQQEAAVWQAVLLSGALVLLVMVLAIIVNGIYQYLVSSRLRGLALELEQITPDDLRKFNEQRTSSKASDDEFDELINGVQSLKLTGQRALRDSDSKRTELETINKAYQALSAVNQLVVEADNEQQLLDGTCLIVRDGCGYLFVWIGMAQHDVAKNVLPVAQAGFEDGYLSTVNITWEDCERGRGPTGTAIRECRSVIARDIANDPTLEPWREQALKQGYASSAAFPIQDDETMYGALMLYSGTIDPFVADEMALLKRLTSNIALGIAKFRAEAQRVVAEQSLRKSEQRFRDFSIASSDWFWETEEDLRFTYFSEQSIDVLGVDPQTLLGRRREEIACIDDAAQQDKWAAHLQVLAEHASFRGFEYHVRSDLGGQWFSISGVPVFDSDGKFRGYHGTGANISVRKQFEIDLIEARWAAESANVTKSRFLATMSHEIRTPMNGILGMAQLLLMPNLTVSNQHDYARIILNSGQTLLRLLNDILDLSKIEAGKFQFESVEFEPKQLVHEIHSLFEGSAKTKNLQLADKWSGPNDQRYRSDSHRLRQMISNLVGNAVKFTEQGHVQIEGTEIERDDTSALLEFSVTDTGIGIPADKLDLLFKPFSQTDSSMTRQFGGSGLGLSIVSSLAKLVGGDVGVQSEAGKGSRFWFRIRADLVTNGADSRRGERSLVAISPLEMSDAALSGHVLVVEDNPVNCMVVEALLTQLGVRVTIVNDGQVAVDAITKGESPDVILMDLHMPVMDGYIAAEKIRAWEVDKQRPRLPIVALTADAFDEDRQHCMAVGMDDFLTKPIALDALKLTLAKWLPDAHQKNAKNRVQLKPVDIDAFNALVSELTPLLQENKFVAVTRFKELQNFVTGTHLAEAVDALAPMMQEIRFDQVLTRLCLISRDHRSLASEVPP